MKEGGEEEEVEEGGGGGGRKVRQAARAVQPRTGLCVFMIYEPDSSRGSRRVHKAACLQTGPRAHSVKTAA